MTKMLLYLVLLLCFSLSVNACSTSEPHSDTNETETPTGSEEDEGKEESTNVMFDLSEGKKGNPPVITLGSGYTMSVLGLGTYSLHGDECINAILSAIKLGYRKFDTATFYGNEEEVGEAIRRSGVPREELFVCTKLYSNEFGNAEKAIEESLARLDIGYVDLMLLHHPGTNDVEAYKAMDELSVKGRYVRWAFPTII